MNRLLKLLEPVTGLFAKQHKNDASKGYSLDTAIERVIESTDSRLRLVPNYKSKLGDAVLTSLDHISYLVDHVPGPVDISRKSFISDPVVRAYFSTPDKLQNIFSCGSELNDFFSKYPQYDKCHALLCANKQEKQRVGTSIVSDSIQKDVLQTAISFYDYKLLSPAVNENKVRQGIKKCIFDGLITHTLQHISSIKNERRELQDQRRILSSQLRSRQNLGGGLTALLMQSQVDAEPAPEISKQLASAEVRLEKMLDKKDVLGFYLSEIVNILEKPEDFIQLNVACFKINDMGVMVGGDSESSSNTVCFSELEIRNVMKRVVTIVSYDKSELDCKQ